ncbi:MAG: hypothetical protein WCV71_02455 [Patescibacteria group bacterium]
MDFLKLVQKKEQKIDNKIIVSTVVLVVLIMSVIVFWPTKQKQHLLTYLPANVSFYYHFTSKKELSQAFFAQEIVDTKTIELEKLLAGDFLNLQEVLWFQTIGDTTQDSYLLKFSRLPKSFLDNFAKKNSEFKASSPEKNILVITKGELAFDLAANQETQQYFSQGISIYWQKNQAPEFLNSLATIVEPIFIGEDVLLNLQKLPAGKNRLSLLEKRNSDLRDIKYFLTPEKFDSVLAFNSILSDEMAENISNNLLRTLFDSLPYYNLSTEVIKNRILSDSMIWQKSDGWILASDKTWQDSILDFMKTFKVKEVAKVLSDGTAYTELVASDEQAVIEHQINGQKVLQMDQLFIFDIGDQHYLSNKKDLIEELTLARHYLKDFLSDCLDQEATVGDFVSLNSSDIPTGVIKDYLLTNNISSLKALSYTTGTVSGLNICF